jgi:hypothetical protein
MQSIALEVQVKNNIIKNQILPAAFIMSNRGTTAVEVDHKKGLVTGKRGFDLK